MAGAGGPSAFAYYTFLAFRAASYDLPEDFLARVGPGLDETTKDRVRAGVTVLQTMRRIDRATMGLAFLGAFLLIGGIIVLGATGQTSLGPTLFVAVSAVWAAAIGLLGFSGLLTVRYRKELRNVLAVYRALQGSSLARDLA